MRVRTVSLLTLAVVTALGACSSQSNTGETSAVASSPSTSMTAAGLDSLSLVLATLDSDTAALYWGRGDRRPDDSSPVRISEHLAWTTTTGRKRVLRMISENVAMEGSRVTLVDMNRDSVADMFWTTEAEGGVGGDLYIAVGDSSKHVFSAANACRIPELRDINDDGVPEILHFQSVAFTRDECEFESTAIACRQKVHADWVAVYSAVRDTIVQLTRGTEAFYRELAGRYEHDAAALRAMSREQGIQPESTCPARVPAVLDSLARLAKRLGASRVGGQR